MTQALIHPSGPFHLTAATDQLLPYISYHASVRDLTSSSSEIISEQVISDFQSLYTTTLEVECKRKQTVSHKMLFLDMFDQFRMKTCKFMKTQQRILKERWMCWAGWMDRQPCNLPMYHILQPHPYLQAKRTRYQRKKKELAAVGLDSSVLSPFTEFNEHDNEFVPLTTSTLDSTTNMSHC